MLLESPVTDTAVIAMTFTSLVSREFSTTNPDTDVAVKKDEKCKIMHTNFTVTIKLKAFS